ncbi:hypothetical protein P9112_008227 [Eukaryota sp. TZLM1-RC]
MFTNKLKPWDNHTPTELEQSVASALFEIETNNQDLGSHLKNCYITSVREVEVEDGRKAIVMFVPVPQLRAFQRIHTRLVDELEKKFSGSSVFIVAQRRILPKPKKNNRQKLQKRPRSRTLTSVRQATLDDLVFPTAVSGKRIRHRMDGTQLQKVFLAGDVSELRCETFPKVYKALTGVASEFSLQN